ncbi:hypothetical protein MO867_22225 [Microbulbifer sp. OS29]|uniref:Uncharacterized protein n=1 Tax=Microbulbifer okhotskensis TaxID=2926617 RepID=A0A9X2ESJ7_9GAMM|nr:hypothetical protein [Microbulbifer okhotskensis]MCO1337044.1 hypothetical protein [Microbulbifer okhotskensis]
MRELELKIDRSTFSLLWMSLHARENELLSRVEQFGEDSDEGADALNDIVALRLYKRELKEQAEKVFDKNAFIVSDESYQ